MKRRFKLHEGIPVEVAGDAAIQSEHFADGRFVPVLILDTRNRPDIDELVRVHGESGLGDVSTTWAALKGVSDVCLLVEFIQPIATTMIVRFDIDKHFSLIDLVLHAHGFYMQGGKPGDRVISTPNAERIVVEVGATGFDAAWNRMLLKVVARRFAAEGFNRKAARALAEQHIAEMRKIMNLRLSSHRSSSAGREQGTS